MTELKPIYPTGYTPWDVYRVVREAWAPYRGFVIDSPPITREELVKIMHFAGYITIAFHQADWKCNIAILDRQHGTNPIATSLEKFKLFYNSVAVADLHLFIVSPCPFHTRVTSYIYEENLTDKITRYSYDHLKTVNPLEPDTSIHTLLDEKETKNLIEYFHHSGHKLMPIYTNDAAIVWSGGEPGQIVKITRKSRVAGKAIGYRQIVRVSMI
jgi:DNA-directed RNA polymerase subunit H (RpoH/RPB5)